MSDFRVDKLFFEPFIAIDEDDETDIVIILFIYKYRAIQ